MTIHVVMEELYGKDSIIGVYKDANLARRYIEKLKTVAFEYHFEDGMWKEYNYYIIPMETLD